MDAAILNRHPYAAPADLGGLARSLRGRLLLPGDAAYDDARRVHNLLHDRRPAAIAQVIDAADIATAIAHARSSSLELAVRAGGHSAAGHGTGDGAFVIDVRRLRGIHIDPQRGVARIGSGLTAGEVTQALAPHGLAIPVGDAGGVGIGGLTLGGGIGWLARSHGLTIDSLRGAEVVTADGEVLNASAREHPDLFWGLRGGGGNFGVARRFEFGLVPIDRVLHGALVLPLTPDVLRGLAAAAAAAPDELTVIAQVMAAPAASFVRPEHHGAPSVVVKLVYAADPDEGRCAVDPFLGLARPMGGWLEPMPYAELYPAAGGPPPGAGMIRASFMDALDEAVAELLVERFTVSDRPLQAMAQLRFLGGAVARVGDGATAYGHRQRPILLSLMTGLDDVATADADAAWTVRSFAALAPWTNGAYAGFLGDEGPGRVADAYPTATWQRLAAVKRRYDPGNVFRRNQNVPTRS